MAPRLSVLIPNFNNGRRSSKSRRDDLLGDLLVSLRETLVDDPTPLEIIACDDGSTDDSLETLRRWSRTPWPDGSRGGQPFLTLIEQDHVGVLSVVANRLVEASRGEVLVRLDGDIVIHTPGWAAVLLDLFDADDRRRREAGRPRDEPGLGVVGPLQLGPDGRVHSFGDAILHPKGYHHLGVGLNPADLAEPREVEHVMGCFYAYRRSVHDRLGGFDETILRGQTIDFGLRARRAGYRCMATPAIRFTHRHSLRDARSTAADGPEGIARALQRFREKWGFDRVAADPRVLSDRYADRPTQWGPGGFADRRWPRDPAADVSLENSQWIAYVRDARTRSVLDEQAGLILGLCAESPGLRTVAVVGCGSGILPHLLSLRGLTMIGVDDHEGRLLLARSCTARQAYPGDPPRFRRQAGAMTLPLEAGEADLVVLLHQLEHHPAPAALLGEARRATRPEGMLLAMSNSLADLTTAQRLGPEADRAFSPQNLKSLIEAAGLWRVATALPDVNRPGVLCLAAQAVPEEPAAEVGTGGGALADGSAAGRNAA